MLYSRSSVFSIDEDGGMVSGVTVSNAIYADGLSKDRLMSEIRNIFSTQMLVLLQLNSFFSGLPAQTVPAAAPVMQPPASAGPPSAPKAAAAVGSPNIFCTNCGGPRTPGQKFCTFCGQAL
jgi:membrane protease subunit (stomatin/prohibitin family)